MRRRGHVRSSVRTYIGPAGRRRAGVLTGASAALQVLLCLAYRSISAAQLRARGLLLQAQLLEHRPPAYAMRPHGPGQPPRPAAAAAASPPSDAASGA
jgi:hypothetical protein